MGEISEIVGCTRERVRQILKTFVRDGIIPENSFSNPARCYRTRDIKEKVRELRPIARFWAGVERSGGPNTCWPWKRSCTPRGYGHLWWGKEHRYEYAHRVAWSLAAGEPVPKGRGKDSENILHHCDNRPCCNPKHLYKGSPADNMKDRDLRGRHGSKGKFKDFCKRGHDLNDPRSLYQWIWDGKPRRACRVCVLIRKKAQYHEKKLLLVA